MDESGQTSAEFILLFGGIIVVVLLVIYMYKDYLMDFNRELESNEVNTFTNEMMGFKKYFS